ncbi:hypothetical protein AZZ99_001099 [Serratia marcescens]|nr:hypothetical protein AZZ99_001099 [Serratia marcescens]
MGKGRVNIRFTDDQRLLASAKSIPRHAFPFPPHGQIRFLLNPEMLCSIVYEGTEVRDDY